MDWNSGVVGAAASSSAELDPFGLDHGSAAASAASGTLASVDPFTDELFIPHDPFEPIRVLESQQPPSRNHRITEQDFFDKFYARPAAPSSVAGARGAVFEAQPQQVVPDPVIGTTLYFSHPPTVRDDVGSKPHWCLFPGRVVAISDPRAIRRELILAPLFDVASLDIRSSDLYALPWPQNTLAGRPHSLNRHHSNSLLRDLDAPKTSPFHNFDFHDTQFDALLCIRCSSAVSVPPNAQNDGNGGSRVARSNESGSEDEIDLTRSDSVQRCRKRGLSAVVEASDEEDAADDSVSSSAAAAAPAPAAAAPGRQGKERVHVRRFMEMRLNGRRMGVTIEHISDMGVEINYWNLASRFRQVLSWETYRASVHADVDFSALTPMEPHEIELTDEQLMYTPMSKLYPSISVSEQARLSQSMRSGEPVLSLELTFVSRFPCTEAWVNECFETASLQDEVILPVNFLTTVQSIERGRDLWKNVVVMESAHVQERKFKRVDTRVWIPAFESFCRSEFGVPRPDRVDEDIPLFLTRVHRPSVSSGAGAHECLDFHRLPGVERAEREVLNPRRDNNCFLLRATRMFLCRIKLNLSLWCLTNMRHRTLQLVLQKVLPGCIARSPKLLDADQANPPSRERDQLLAQGAKLVELAAATTHARDQATFEAAQKSGAQFPVSLVMELPLADFQCCTVQWMVEQERSLETSVQQSRPTELFRPYVEQIRLTEGLPPVTIRLDAFGDVPALRCDPTLNVARVCGGYLGDDMGAGKTMEMLAVILYDQRNLMLAAAVSPGERDASGFLKSHATLIVVSTSLIGQWLSTLKEYAPHLSVLNYNALTPARRRDSDDVTGHNIVVVSNAVLRKEVDNAWKRFEQLQRGEPWSIRLDQPARYRSILQQIAWRRVVIDEAHDKKSSSSHISRILAGLNAQRRWCLSGTPVGLNSSELLPMCEFLGLDAEFRTAFGIRFRAVDNTSKRRRTSATDGSARPSEQLCNETLQFLSRFARHTLLRHELNRTYLGRPNLWRLTQKESTTTIEFDTTQRHRYDKAYKAARDQLVVWSANDQRDTTMHVVHTLLQPLLRMCSAGPMDSEAVSRAIQRVEQRRRYIAQANLASPPSNSDANRVSPDALKHKQSEFLAGHEKCPVCLSTAQELLESEPAGAPMGVQTPCSHVFCKPCVTEVLQHARSSTFPCSLCNSRWPGAELKDFQIIPHVETPSEEDDDDERKSGEQPAAAAAASPEAPVSNDAKIARLIQLVYDVRERDPASKFVVMLPHAHTFRALEQVLPERGLNTVALRSSYSEARRTRILDSFNTDPDLNVLLLSMRGSGAGLSLECANHIVIFDTVMDVSLLKQAPKRIARFNQEREIHTHHFVMKNTIEERLREIIARTAAQANAGRIQHLGSFEELQALFGI